LQNLDHLPLIYLLDSDKHTKQSANFIPFKPKYIPNVVRLQLFNTLGLANVLTRLCQRVYLIFFNYLKIIYFPKCISFANVKHTRLHQTQQISQKISSKTIDSNGYKGINFKDLCQIL
jgi:hypothetical protein